MTEPLADELKPRKILPVVPVIVGAVMFAAAFWAGGRIADGEIAMLTLDERTAQGHLVKIKTAMPPGAVIDAAALDEVTVYANRIEPYCINSAAAAVGKKSKYGLAVGQILTVKDLE